MVTIVVIESVLLVACLVLVFALAHTMKGLRDQVESLEGQVLRLSVQVQEQEKQIEALTAQPEEATSALPIAGIMPIVSGFAGGASLKRMLPSLALFGFQLIAAYLRKRSANAPSE
ncbi:MAG: hypothetical protein K1X67_16590 [Fimbriimonadaceae bacterium]|nr:hypothetical protein [Fimbriimonadaceae bacterium]